MRYAGSAGVYVRIVARLSVLSAVSQFQIA